MAASTVVDDRVGESTLPTRGAPSWPGVRRHTSVRRRPARSVELPTSAPRNVWVRPYLVKLVASDFAAAAVAGALAYLVRLPQDRYSAQGFTQQYLPASLALPLVWLIALSATDAYDKRILSVGPHEFQRVGRALLVMMAVVGFASYALQANVARGYVVIAIPLAAALTIGGRYVVRKHLHRARIRGEVRTAVVAVGDAEAVADLATRMHAESYIGMRVVGACIPRRELTDTAALERLAAAGVTPLGDLDSVVTAVSRSQADTVAVTSSNEMSPRRLRELSWQLEQTDADLVVAPGLIEVAGPRLHIRPLTGLPLLQVEKPEFAGVRRVVKGLADRTAALLGLLVISPLLLMVYAGIKLTSAGPAFFRQTRVGKDGREFTIWKFRSMYVNAEQRLTDLLDQNQNADGLLFKIRNDPRVTGIGRFIRRYSIDELPQLINVVNGSMSLVGPRPPLPQEVAQYQFDVRRRLLVRPGLTGLWQVSGRSDLAWDEAVRLDLRYVENWSLGQDALILWKTASAVLRGTGAY